MLNQVHTIPEATGYQSNLSVPPLAGGARHRKVALRRFRFRMVHYLAVTLPYFVVTLVELGRRSTFGNGLVEQQDLLLIGRLKNRCPLFEVSPCHRRGRPLARYVSTFSSLD